MCGFFRQKTKESNRKSSDSILIWTGPRATDIIDCENGLFDGSVTLYGWEPTDDSVIPSDNADYGQFFRRVVCDCKGGPPAGEGGVKYGINYGENREDKKGRLIAPNHNFCQSKYNLDDGRIINHNRSDLEEGDLYILAEQILLMDNPYSVDVHFMSYNQNFVGRHGSEDQYMLLAGMLILNSQKDVSDLIRSMCDLYEVRKEGLTSRNEKDAIQKMESAMAIFRRLMSEREKLPKKPPGTIIDYNGSPQIDRLENYIDPGTVLDRTYDDSAFKNMDRDWSDIKAALRPQNVRDMLKLISDALGFSIKVRGLRSNFATHTDADRRGFVDNIHRVWNNHLKFDKVCKIARLTNALGGEIDILDAKIMTLVKRHLEDIGEDTGFLKDCEKASDYNMVWMMKYLSEAIITHMVCLNKNEKLMGVLDSKEGFRDFCKTHEIPTTENIIIKENGEDCSLNVFKNYIRCDKFVIQKNHSSGGFGTYLYEWPKPLDADISRRCDEERKDPSPGSMDYARGKPLTKEVVNEKIAADLVGCTKGDLILSKYRDPSISVNIHCMISEKEILYSPGSVQIILNTEGRLMYSGADFIAFEQYKKDNPGMVSTIMGYLDWMCGSLRGYGYRGIIGFDIIISEEYGVEFVEANNRFQASSCLLNKKLRNIMFDNGEDGHVNRRYDQKPISSNYRFPSLQLLNLMCFDGKDVCAFDAESETVLEGRQKDYHELMLGYARRFCNECVSDNKLKRLPVLNSEFANINVPYSMFIFYNSGPFHEQTRKDEDVSISGMEHYRMFCECMDEMHKDERDAYKRRMRDVNNDIIVQVGRFLHGNKRNNESKGALVSKSLQLRSQLLNDGITNRYFRAAMDGLKKVIGAISSNNSDPTVLGKCEEILKSLPPLLYSDFAPTCDLVCVISDSMQYYIKNLKSGVAQSPLMLEYIKDEVERWVNVYERRAKYLDKLIEGTGAVIIDPVRASKLTDEQATLKALKELSDKIQCKNEKLKSNVLDERESTTREFMSLLATSLESWIVHLGCNLRCDETSVDTEMMSGFSEYLDNVLAVIFMKEKENIFISKSRQIYFRDNMTGGFAGITGHGVEAIEKFNSELKQIIDSESKSKRKFSMSNSKSDKFNLGVIPEIYEIITRNPLHKIQLCNVSNGEVKDPKSDYDQNAFITKVVFYTNICSTNLGKVVVHPNIVPPDTVWNKRILCPEGAEYLALKIGLINNGIRLDESMKKRFNARPGVNSSVDLLIKCKEYADYGVLRKGTSDDDWEKEDFGSKPGGDVATSKVLPINCAYNNKIAIFSPFKLTLADKGEGKKSFTINYYGRPIKISVEKDKPATELEVGFYHDKDKIKGLTSKNRIPKSSIAFIATDRVRFQHNDGCRFASRGRGCKFCEFTVKKNDNRSVSFGEDDILDVVKDVMKKRMQYGDYKYVWSPDDEEETEEGKETKWCFDHVLIGGGTLSSEHNLARDRIAKIAKTIIDTEKQRAESCDPPEEPKDLNIYLMCVPPEDLDDLRIWKEAGITEVGFNLEVYTRTIARRIMPGKSRISRSTYLSALTRAVHTWETRGAVRSAFIIGLEKESATIEGVAMLTSLGVEPILSIFRPVEGTELSYVMPLSSPLLHEIYREAQALCTNSLLRLGPDCIHCQNNTLSLPEVLEYESR